MIIELDLNKTKSTILKNIVCENDQLFALILSFFERSTLMKITGAPKRQQHVRWAFLSFACCELFTPTNQPNQQSLCRNRVERKACKNIVFSFQGKCRQTFYFQRERAVLVAITNWDSRSHTVKKKYQNNPIGHYLVHFSPSRKYFPTFTSTN